MASVYILSILLLVGLVKTGPLNNEQDVAFIGDIRGSNRQIIGGIEATEGQFPYQVHLRTVRADGVVQGCGGSIIHNEWILTAAHCLGNFVSFVVRLGVINLDRPLLVLEESDDNAFVHPTYINDLNQVQPNDIGLLKLSTSVSYEPTIQPIRLQNTEQKDLDYTDDRLVVSGFGYTDDAWLGDSSSDILLWTFVRGYSNENCDRMYHNVPNLFVTVTTICAVNFNATQSTCNGEGGDPLTKVDEDGKVTLVGVVSFGSRLSCTIGRPTGHIRPGHFHEWFEQVTGINFDWNSYELESESEVEIDRDNKQKLEQDQGSEQDIKQESEQDIEQKQAPKLENGLEELEPDLEEDVDEVDQEKENDEYNEDGSMEEDYEGDYDNDN